MPSNTIYTSLTDADMTIQNVKLNLQGVSANPTANSTTNIDYTLVDDCEFTGFNIITNGATYGDYVNIYVLDNTNTIIAQPLTKGYVSATDNLLFVSTYPSKIIAGYTIRIAYTNTSLLSTPFLGVNYLLHKILF